MQSVEQSSALKVAGAVRVAAFENPLRCRVLITCVREERSLSDLQRVLGQPLPRLHYHVRRLLDAGLLTVARSQPRAGRPVRFYRAVAESFLVPQDSLPALPSAEWAAELRQSLHNETVHGGEPALLYGPGAEDGSLLVRLVRSDPAAPSRAMDLWRVVRLGPRQRAALAKELAEVFARYAAAEPETGADTYLAHAAFAPRLSS